MQRYTMITHHDDNAAEEADDKPPILGTWRQVYVLVLVLHTLLIALFYWFTSLHS